MKILDELLSDRMHDRSVPDLLEEVNTRLAEIYPDKDGITRKTLEQDLNYLAGEKSFIFADIETYRVAYYNAECGKTLTKQCKRYRKKGFSIFKKELTQEQKSIISQAMSILGRFDGLPELEYLEELRGVVGENENRKIISMTKNPLENSTLIGHLYSAIYNRQVIELHYHLLDSPEVDKQVNLHPQLLKEYNRNWFLFATAEDTGKLLMFSLDRVNDVVTLPSHTYKEYEGDFNERFDDIIGVSYYEGNPVEHILFWVSDKSKYHVLSKPLHESQRHYTRDKEKELRQRFPKYEGGFFFSIDCVKNYELIRELCSFGKDLIVLQSVILETGEEGRVKSDVIEHIQELYTQYQAL